MPPDAGEGGRFRNRDGTPVDPVPFLVVSALGFTVSFSYGPVYLAALGVPLGRGLYACGGVVAAITAVAYHRYVWTARPALRAEIPAAIRLRRLAYAALVGGAGLLLLALPLAAR